MVRIFIFQPFSLHICTFYRLVEEVFFMKDQKAFFCICRGEESCDLLSERLFLCLISSFLDQIDSRCLCQADFILFHHLDALI